MRPFSLTPEQRQQIETLLSGLEGDPRHPLRRRLLALMLYDRGERTSEAAAGAGLSKGRTRYWRRRFNEGGMQIFQNTLSRFKLSNDSPPPGQDEGAAVQLPDLQASGTSPDGQIGIETPLQALPGETPEQEIPGGHLLETAFEAVLGNISSGLPFPAPMSSAGVTSEDPMAEAGRKIMLFHFAEMIHHEPGTRQGADIEELHDMRVATRRLRAAFDIFGGAFNPKTIKTYLKGMRAAGRALGRVRDLDVFIEKAYRYLDSLPLEQRSDLDPLVAAWTQERDGARTVMLAHLDSQEWESFKTKFNVFVQTPGKGARQDGESFPASGLVREAAPVIIYSRLAAARAYAPVLSSASLEELHALRIEFKKLRYAVEFFRETLGPEAKGVIQALKGVQDHLGDLNDARVACGLLGDFLSNWEQRQASQLISARQNPAGIAAYLAAKHAELHHLMVTFPKAWSKFDSEDFRRAVALAIASL